MKKEGIPHAFSLSLGAGMPRTCPATELHPVSHLPPGLLGVKAACVWGGAALGPPRGPQLRAAWGGTPEVILLLGAERK